MQSTGTLLIEAAQIDSYGEGSAQEPCKTANSGCLNDLTKCVWVNLSAKPGQEESRLT
jgi:hypothetical protein